MIPVGMPLVGDEEITAVSEVIWSGYARSGCGCHCV